MVTFRQAAGGDPAPRSSGGAFSEYVAMRIAIDAMGGDHAPEAAVEGAVLARRELAVEPVLVGDGGRVESVLRALREQPRDFSILHTDEAVAMDEPATTPLRRKRRASVRLCAELVQEGKAAAMVTAGNTGAAMVAAKVAIGMLEGVDRPALATVLPSLTGRTVLLDVGANVDSRARHLRQFAVMGHCYAQEVLGVAAPRIGLLSIGEEDGKGTERIRQVHQVMESTGLHFIGNVEGGDIFGGRADVVVCDGFVGNAVLKSAESIADLLAAMLRDELAHSLSARLGAWLARPALRRLRRRTDPSEYGGAPLLGLAGGCLIGHGRSSARAIRNMIARAAEFAQADVARQIGRRIAALRAGEFQLLADEDATTPEVTPA